MILEKHLKLFNIFRFKSFDEIENFAYTNWPKPTKKEIKFLNDESKNIVDDNTPN